MTDPQLHDPELERHIAAYRAAEPRRRRDPFTDPRLARIAAERAARTTGWRRFLATSPLVPLAPALLAFVLAVAPAPAVPLPVALDATTPTVSMSAAPAVEGTKLLAAEPASGADPLRVAAALAAAAGVVLAMRRLRRRA